MYIKICLFNSLEKRISWLRRCFGKNCFERFTLCRQNSIPNWCCCVKHFVQKEDKLQWFFRCVVVGVGAGYSWNRNRLWHWYTVSLNRFIVYGSALPIRYTISTKQHVYTSLGSTSVYWFPAFRTAIRTARDH